MRYLTLILVALASCAAPQHTSSEYQRGTYAPVRPAPARPGVGAPVVGQPGYVGPLEGLPRSPHGRVLPETPETRREPGIWSAEPPDATLTLERDRVPAILGVSIPLPSTNSDVDFLLARGCADTMSIAAKKILKSFDAIPELKSVFNLPVKRCAAARLYRECVGDLTPDSSMYKFLDTKVESGLDEAIKRASEVARLNVKRECSKVSLSPDLKAFVYRVDLEWIKLIDLLWSRTQIRGGR